jgi:hypothetical protein
MCISLKTTPSYYPGATNIYCVTRWWGLLACQPLLKFGADATPMVSVTVIVFFNLLNIFYNVYN